MNRRDKVHTRPLLFAWMALLAIPTALACGGGHLAQSPDAEVADGTAPPDPGKDPGPAKPAKLAWPPERLVVEGARAPALAIAGSTVLLAYSRADKELVLRAGAEAGTEEVLSTRDEPGVTLTGHSAPKIAADPAGRQAVVLWAWGEADLRRAWWRDGKLEATDLPTIDFTSFPLMSWNPARGLSVAWSSGGPLAALQSSQPNLEIQYPDGTWAPPQKARDTWYALKIPGPAEPPAPWPDASVELADYAGGMFLGYGEVPSILPLAPRPEWGTGPAALVAPSFQPWEMVDGTAKLQGMRWTVARLVPGSAGRNGRWLEPVTRGVTDLPDPQAKAWIQMHPLAADHGILTYCRPDGDTAVYDVFAQRYVLAADGTPSVEGEAVNVSETFGWTDHSEYPLVLPAGDGRFWIAWRESEFGPRVALYDALMRRVGIAAPDVDLHQGESEAIAAAVDATGALHLAAVTFSKSTQQDSGPSEVRYWVLPRP